MSSFRRDAQPASPTGLGQPLSSSGRAACAPPQPRSKAGASDSTSGNVSGSLRDVRTGRLRPALTEIIETMAPLGGSSDLTISATLHQPNIRRPRGRYAKHCALGSAPSPRELHDAAVAAREATRQEWGSTAVAAALRAVAPYATTCNEEPATNRIRANLQDLAQSIGSNGDTRGQPPTRSWACSMPCWPISKPSTSSRTPSAPNAAGELSGCRSYWEHGLNPAAGEEAGAVLRQVRLTSIVEHLQLSDRRLGRFNGETTARS